jgi:hypothetical protein
MATPSEISSESTDPYPDELVAAVVCEAEADADRVAEFLIGLGFGPHFPHITTAISPNIVIA